MVVRKVGSAWDIAAPAKLNLYLDVLGRRTDGFHELETLMAPVRVYDRLRWRAAAAPFSLQYDPATSPKCRAAAPPDENNLVWRAVDRLAREAGRPASGRVTLLKRIPVQAGLGGGSSDAAAALLLANAAWGLNYPMAGLMRIAADLGSDVPFFLAGQSAVCRGRGEQVEPVGPLPRLNVVIICPPAGVPTAAAFARLNVPPDSPRERASPDRLSRLIAALQAGSVRAAAHWMTNRLQSAASELCQWIERSRRAMASLGCLAHQMTGSGSAYFGVMRSARHARRVANVLSSRGLGTVIASATCL